MISLSFQASVVTRTDGTVLIVLFDPRDNPVALARCSDITARTLVANISSALGSSETRD